MKLIDLMIIGLLLIIMTSTICGKLDKINDNLTELNTQLQIASEAVLGVGE